MMRASMSQCSTLIADLGDGVLVAHISYSEREPLEAILTELDHRGVPSDQRYVVASQTPDTAASSIPRIDDPEEYVALGIPANNIYTFPYHFEHAEQSMHRGLTQVLVTGDGFYTWSFDQLPSSQSADRNRPDAAYRDERAVRFTE